jgi:hypothetical protein
MKPPFRLLAPKPHMRMPLLTAEWNETACAGSPKGDRGGGLQRSTSSAFEITNETTQNGLIRSDSLGFAMIHQGHSAVPQSRELKELKGARYPNPPLSFALCAPAAATRLRDGHSSFRSAWFDLVGFSRICSDPASFPICGAVRSALIHLDSLMPFPAFRSSASSDSL